MIRGRYLTSKNASDELFDVRAAVFGEELGLGDLAVRDEGDEMAVYAVAFDAQGSLAATGRLYLDDEGRFTLDCVATLAHARGMGLGDLVARMLLSRAVELYAAHVTVRTLPEAAAFFARYGFEPMEEIDAGSPRLVRMRATAQAIDLSGGCQRKK